MKIRKANLITEEVKIENVYLYENKKEEYTVVSIPDIEWSTLTNYDENREELRTRLQHSLEKRVPENEAEQLKNKIVQWVSEM